MIDLLIDSTSVSSLGFSLKKITGHLSVGEPKQQGSGKEDLTSENFFLPAYRQKSPDVAVQLFGKFASIQAAETAIYTLYGLLIQPGKRTFTHTNGTYSIVFDAIMNKGATVEHTVVNEGLFFEVTLKLMKC